MKSYHRYIKNIIEKDPSIEKNIQFESWLFELGFNIAKLRKEKNYSQKEFAQKLGMKQSTIARIENGQNMRCSTLWDISEELGEELKIFNASKFAEQNKLVEFCDYSTQYTKAYDSSSNNKFEYEAEHTTNSIIDNFFKTLTTKPT